MAKMYPTVPISLISFYENSDMVFTPLLSILKSQDIEKKIRKN